MDDKELVEVWRKEFELLTGDNAPRYTFDKLSNGIYKHQRVWDQFHGFCMAKRSQPSVVLPQHIILTLALGDTVPLLTKSDVIESLNAAGIKYTAKD